MKYILILISFLSLYGFDIKIHVNDLKNSKGVVLFNLYNKDGSIPDKNFNQYFKQKISKIKNNSSYTIFHNIPKGRYAVGVIHDENNNSKVDKGFILPTEGIGFSNFDTINLLNKPNFKKASFEVNKNINIKIKIIYF